MLSEVCQLMGTFICCTPSGRILLACTSSVMMELLVACFVDATISNGCRVVPFKGFWFYCYLFVSKESFSLKVSSGIERLSIASN